MPSRLQRSAVASGLLVLAGSAGAVTLGQVDDFESGGLQSWASGPNNPNGPAIEASGGPAGADDNYLRLSANGLSGAGGKLVAFNSVQWAGDYLAAGIDTLRMQVNNLGATDLVLRLLLQNEAQAFSLVTLDPVDVAAGSGWNTVNFSLAAANLDGGDYTGVLGNVTLLNLVHSPDVVFSRGSFPAIAAQLGVDNISAVPEASTLLQSALGLALVAAGVSRKRSKP